MNKKNMHVLLSALLLCLLSLSLVTAAKAAPNAPTTLNQVSSSYKDLSGLPGVTANAQGGNVTQINIATLTITKSWAGYYGNISGVVTLQDATNQTFYNWTMTSFSGRVFATRVSSVLWNTVNCTNGTNETTEMTYLNQSSTDSDSVINTFNQTNNPAFAVGTANIIANSCHTTHGYVNNNSQNSAFPMVLLSPTSGDVIYTTLLNHSNIGFDGQPHDFELLVGQNQKAAAYGTVTPYYFWTEFS